MRRNALPVLLMLAAGTAQAQAPSSPAQPSPVPPAQQAPPAPPTPPSNPNPDQAACPPGVGANPPTVGSGQSSQDLSDKLARSNGVICPPAQVDPKMGVQPPGGGRTPVVPPPGTPGGDQNTVPK